MKCNKNTNFRISLVPQRSCVSTHSPWKSIILRTSRNLVLHKSDFSFVVKRLKWDQQEKHTHTHTQRAESSSPTCTTLVSHSSVLRLSPVYSAALVVVCLLRHHDDQLSHVWDGEGRSPGPPAGHSAPTAGQRWNSTANCMLWVSTKQTHIKPPYLHLHPQT